jgi:NADH:ubiquinone oxidoreductase subunit H
MKVLIVALAIVLAVAFMTLAERKFMGSIQRRLGPNILVPEKKHHIFC